MPSNPHRLVSVPRPKQIAIWGAWYGSRNVGDQAVLISIAQLLREHIPEFRLTVFTDDPDHVNSYAARESGSDICAMRSKADPLAVLRTVRDADLLIIGGGVPFFDSFRHASIMRILAWTARRSCTPYLTWAVASQAIRSVITRQAYRSVIAHASALTCRDHETQMLFRGLDPTMVVHQVADPVFALQGLRDIGLARYRISGERCPGRPLVGMVPRSLRPDDRSANVHYGRQSRISVANKKACFARALDRLWTLGYQTLFIPMNTVAPDDDRDAAREIIGKADYGRHALLVDQAIRPQEIPGLLSNCEFAICARVHGSITAMIANTPVIMYAFDRKHHGIMQSMELGNFVFDPTTHEHTKIDHLIDLLSSSITDTRARMRVRLEVLRQQARQPARIASELLA